MALFAINLGSSSGSLLLLTVKVPTELTLLRTSSTKREPQSAGADVMDRELTPIDELEVSGSPDGGLIMSSVAKSPAIGSGLIPADEGVDDVNSTLQPAGNGVTPPAQSTVNTTGEMG